MGFSLLVCLSWDSVYHNADGCGRAAKTACPICSKTMRDNSQGLVILFLCRHVVHASCIPGRDVSGGEAGVLLSGLEQYLGDSSGFVAGGRKGISGSIAL